MRTFVNHSPQSIISNFAKCKISKVLDSLTECISRVKVNTKYIALSIYRARCFTAFVILFHVREFVFCVIFPHSAIGRSVVGVCFIYCTYLIDLLPHKQIQLNYVCCDGLVYVLCISGEFLSL